MTTTSIGAESVPMSDETRGHAIKRRRLAHGISSVRKFAELTNVSRDAVTAAEAGDASDATYERLESWLDRFDEETGSDDIPGDDMVEFRLSGNFGVDVVVKGPVTNLAELENSVEKLLRRMQQPDAQTD